MKKLLVGTDSNIPVPHDWKESIRYFFHDRYKAFNAAILFYALIISPFIIFQKESPELNSIHEINVFGIVTQSTLKFILFGNTILLALVVIHANYILHIIYEHLRRKKE